MIRLEPSENFIWALVDTGSKSTIVKPEVLPKNVKVRKSNIALKGAAGSEIKNHGHVSKLMIDIYDSKFYPDVLVADISQQFILGLDFLQSQKFNIDWENLTMKLGGTVVPLTTSKPSKNKGWLLNTENVIVDGSSALKCKVDGEISLPCTVLYKSSIKGLSNKIHVCNITESEITIPTEYEGEQPIFLRKNEVIGEIQELFINELEQNPPPELSDDELVEILGIKTNDHLSGPEKQELIDLVLEFRDVFANSATNIGTSMLYSHEIVMKDDRIINLPARRIPAILFDKVKEMLTELAEAGVIEPSDSQYNSPLMCVPKPHGGYRLVLDLRKINENTRKETYPLPVIDELKCLWEGAKYFTSCDVLSAFNHVCLTEKSRDYTSFSVPNFGRWRFKRLPQGAKNSSYAMQMTLDMLFRDTTPGTVSCYIDDILSTANTFQSAMTKLREILERLQWAGIKLSAKKSHLLRKETTFCGLVMNENGIRPNEKKIKAIQDMAVPRTRKQVMSFLGMASYWRSFVKSFAEVSRALSNTLRGQPFKMTSEAEESFENVKRCLASPPILAFPTENDTFILQCDASEFAIGACLLQKQNNQEKAIAYASKCLSPAECKWATFKKEYYSIFYNIRKFRYYLFGREFVVQTDHKGLTYNKALEKRISYDAMLRWAIELSTYEFTVEYKKGEENVTADMLSRLPQKSDKFYDWFVENIIAQAQRKPLPLEETSVQDDGMDVEPIYSVIQTIKPPDWLRNAQLECETIQTVVKWIETGKVEPKPNTLPIVLRQYHAKRQLLELEQGMLVRKYIQPKSKTIRKLYCVPQNSIFKVIDNTHILKAQHLGHDKTYHMVKENFWFPNMAEVVRDRVQSCMTCFRTNVARMQKQVPKMGGEIFTNPNIMISYDILQVSKEEFYGKVLVIVDAFTKWTSISVLRDGSARNVAQALIKDWIAIHGVPVYLKSDNAKSFKEAHLIQELHSIMGIEPKYISPYNPRANGGVERMNSTILQILRKICANSPSTWRNSIPMVTFAINTAVSTMTGISPAELMMGRKLRGIDAIVLGIHQTEYYVNEYHYKSEMYRRLTSIYEAVASEMGSRWVAYKNIYDSNKKCNNINTDDLVLLHRPINTTNKFHKLQHQFKGPYRVIRVISEHNMELLDLETGERRIENRSLIRRLPKNVTNIEPLIEERETENEQRESDTDKAETLLLRRGTRVRKQPDRYGN